MRHPAITVLLGVLLENSVPGHARDFRLRLCLNQCILSAQMRSNGNQRGARADIEAIGYRVVTAYLLLSSSLAIAQMPQAPQRPPDGGTREVLISILIPSLPNAPFSATVVTESIRQLADGTAITQGNRRAIARDRAGRIYQERRLLVPADGKHESVLTQIEISDPLAHTLYICIPKERVCQVELFSAPDFVPPPTAATVSREPGSVTLKDLGKQNIGGLETVGTRQTGVIETGTIGNNSPIEIKREYWYSPQLGVNLISKVQDPRIGALNFEVAEIVLGEPDPKLFQPPRDSKVIDLRKPARSTQPEASID